MAGAVLSESAASVQELLAKMKEEILSEVRSEIEAAKKEILDGLCSDEVLSNYYGLSSSNRVAEAQRGMMAAVSGLLWTVVKTNV